MPTNQFDHYEQALAVNKGQKRLSEIADRDLASVRTKMLLGTDNLEIIVKNKGAGEQKRFSTHVHSQFRRARSA